MATNRLPRREPKAKWLFNLNLEIGARPQAACGSTLTFSKNSEGKEQRTKTKIYIAIVTGLAFGCLAIVSRNGIPENMVACWPLATVVGAVLIALGVVHPHRPEKQSML